MVHGKQRDLGDGVIHRENGDVFWSACQAPARLRPAANPDQACLAQITEAAPDDHWVGVNAGGNLVRRQPVTPLLLGKRQPGQGVYRNGEPAVRCHGSQCNRISYNSVDQVASEPHPRYWELLCLVAVGHTNAQIARRLDVTEKTVGKHLENIYTRLQVSSRTAAVTRAFPDGTTQTPPVPGGTAA